jgi:hypothetical protein
MKTNAIERTMMFRHDARMNRIRKKRKASMDNKANSKICAPFLSRMYHTGGSYEPPDPGMDEKKKITPIQTSSMAPRVRITPWFPDRFFILVSQFLNFPRTSLIRSTKA